MFNSIEINSDSQYKLLNIEESQYCDVKSEMIDPLKIISNYIRICECKRRRYLCWNKRKHSYQGTLFRWIY